MLLNDWHFLRRHFNAKIAARDHHTVRGFKNVFELIDGLRLFQFRNHGHASTFARLDQILHRPHIGGGTNKRDRNHIDAVAQAKLQIFAIFLSQSGNAERDARQIDALVFAERSAMDDFALHIHARER